MFGWLIPTSKASQFNEAFMKGEYLSDWNDYNVWVVLDIIGKALMN